MKFRTKIKLSFAAMVIIPIAVMLLLLTIIINIHERGVENKYGINHVGMEGLTNQTKIYSKLTHDVYNEIVGNIQKNPEKLMDQVYLNTLNHDLLNKFSFIIAKKNDNVIYNGGNADEKQLVEKLPNYRGDYEYPKSYVGDSYIYGDYQYLVKQVTFEIDEKQSGTICIVTKMEGTMTLIKRMIIEMCLAIIGIVVLTAMSLGVWTQRSIMTPLDQLTEATKRIADGELNFKLERTGKDEFGDLCEDFEYMRQKLKESVEEHMKYDEESKELISNISHDLKTPLTAIKGYVEGIMDGVANTPEKMDKYIKTIYNKANDMDKLIGELMIYSKLDMNKVTYNFKKVNVDEYFSDCAEEIATELEAKNIDLKYSNYVEKDAVVIADPEQMKRVINNIISNSVKYIGNKKGAVNIRINDKNDFICVEIEDNGKGINQKELPYIFDRFYRTDSSRNSSQGGSGIGLAIVRKIIEDHGGNIWATSRENTGTIMHFILRKYFETEVKAEYEQDTNN